VVSRTEATRAVRAREPVPARRQRAPEPAPRAAAPPVRRPSRGAAIRRWVTLLLIMLLVAAAVVLALSSLGGEGGVQLRNVVEDNVPDSVDAMKQLVEDNTR
jgi:hypothetical protein